MYTVQFLSFYHVYIEVIFGIENTLAVGKKLKFFVTGITKRTYNNKQEFYRFHCWPSKR